VSGGKGSREMLGVEEMRFGFLLIVLSLSIYTSTFYLLGFLFILTVFSPHTFVLISNQHQSYLSATLVAYRGNLLIG